VNWPYFGESGLVQYHYQLSGPAATALPEPTSPALLALGGAP
jgi:hypothetical protein